MIYTIQDAKNELEDKVIKDIKNLSLGLKII